MNTLKNIAENLRQGRGVANDVALAKQTGLTRQSISRALSGDHNFNVTTLLAIAQANGQEVMLVPRDVARALAGTHQPLGQTVPTMADELKRL